MLRRILSKLSRLVRKRAIEQETEDELRFHIEMETEANRARGMSVDQARLQALRDLGGLTQTREAVRAVRSSWFDAAWQDLRYSLRLLRRSPMFSALAVLVLALGIGVNTAVFSIIDSVFFRPLPVDAPEQLTYIYQVPRSGRPQLFPFGDIQSFPGFYGDAFSGFTAHWSAGVVLGADGESERTQAEIVTASYFDVVGVSPFMGRTFRPEEDDKATTERAVVISHDLWTRRFKSDPSIVGKEVRLNEKIFHIVGVIGPEFVGLSDPWRPSRLWVVSAQFWDERFGMAVVARMKPGVSLEQAKAVVDSRTRPLQESWKARWGHYLSVESRAKQTPLPHIVLRASDVRMPFDPSANVVPPRLVSAVVVVVAIVLLIAAANIAGVLAGRGVARSGELAVRQALGAGGSRVVRQLLTESVVLSTAGGFVGLLVAWLAVSLYETYTPSRFVIDVSFSTRILLFTAMVCVGAGVAVGLAPARQVFNVNVTAVLGGGVTGTQRVRRRLRHWIVIPQVALSIVLLVVAGVHVRALLRIETKNIGHRTDALVVMYVGHWDQFRSGFGDAPNFAKRAERNRAFYRALFERLRTVPGHGSVAITSALPVYSGIQPSKVIGQSAFLNGSTDAFTAWESSISTGFFQTMGMALRGGRDFDDRDVLTSPPVVIVSEALAKRMWPTGNAVGQSLAFYAEGSPNAPQWREVVGIVNETDPIVQQVGDRPMVYTPLAQNWEPSSLIVVADTRGDPSARIRQLKDAIAGADSFAEVRSVQSLDQIVNELLYPRRAAAGILVACGLVGLVLACIGLYGVISYSVAQRLRELGIRSTLGADQRDIVALVLREAVSVSALGAVPGLFLSLVALRLTSSLVGEVPTFDPVAFLVVPVLTLGLILLASYIPARRAASIDPVAVLRGL